MAQQIPDRLLVDRITIRKPVQTFVPGTKKPVFEYQTVTTGVKARFNPASTSLNRNVFGQVPTKVFRLFLNEPILSENDEIVWEGTGQTFLVTQGRNFFGRHFEVQVEETHD